MSHRVSLTRLCDMDTDSLCLGCPQPQLPVILALLVGEALVAPGSLVELRQERGGAFSVEPIC